MTTPRLIRRTDADRITWGTKETGYVPDLIYMSDDTLHVIEFSLADGGRFVHSLEKRTVFGADEVFHTLEGTLLLSNPETGEVHPVPEHHSAFFRRNTWHHGFAHRGDTRVLEFMSPPPAAGTTQAYARTRPYLSKWRYSETEWQGKWPMEREERRTTITVVGPKDRLWSLGDDRGLLLLGLVASTEHLTVYTGNLDGDVWTHPTSYDGTAALFVTQGSASIRSDHGHETAEVGDVVVLTSGVEHSFRGERTDFLLGIGHPTTES
jgi:uncharacterized cupin superfamily protein